MPKIEVTASKDRRRAGFRFPRRKPVTLDLADLSDAQIEALRDDPHLSIEGVADDDDTPPPVKPATDTKARPTSGGQKGKQPRGGRKQSTAAKQAEKAAAERAEKLATAASGLKPEDITAEGMTGAMGGPVTEDEIAALRMAADPQD